MSIALTSHGDVGRVGVTADRGAIRDADVFTECLELGFDEVLDVGRE